MVAGFETLGMDIQYIISELIYARTGSPCPFFGEDLYV
jgi:hypothetical protein